MYDFLKAIRAADDGNDVKSDLPFMADQSHVSHSGINQQILFKSSDFQFRTSETGGTFGFDFNENENVAIHCDDVDLGSFIPVVTAKDFQPIPLKEIGCEVLTPLAMFSLDRHSTGLPKYTKNLFFMFGDYWNRGSYKVFSGSQIEVLKLPRRS